MIEFLRPALEESSRLIKDTKFPSMYTYEDRSIPRVTEILSSMLHEEYLMNWANAMGFKHKGYRALLREAAEKGTYTHQSIEDYLLRGVDPNYDDIPFLARDTVRNTFEAFYNWWKCITTNNDVEIIGVEQHIKCKYFGGTYDCLIKINGKIWLVDFKSSNHLSYKYYLQLSAYAYMIKESTGIEIDGCIILMLNKFEPIYSENVLDFSKTDHKAFFNDCTIEFLSLVVSYYGRVNIENQFKILFN